MTALLLAGMGELVDMKKWPPARLFAFDSERQEVSLWADRTMSEAWYVLIASGWVAA